MEGAERGEEGDKRGGEEENKEVIAQGGRGCKFDFFYIHCQFVALRGRESEVHFRVSIVREIRQSLGLFLFEE